MKKLSKNATITIVIIAILILGAIGFFLAKKYLFPNPLDNDPDGSDSSVQNQSSSSKPVNSNSDINPDKSDFPLKVGSKGQRVKELQAALNYYKGASLKIDGNFGPKTLEALKSAYNVSSVSWANYQVFVKPWLKQINAYIDSHQ